MSDKAVEFESIAFTTAGKEANFESLCLGVSLYATQDCYIAFDRPVNAGDFYIKAGANFDIPVKFTRISAMQVSSGGTLYLLARR